MTLKCFVAMAFGRVDTDQVYDKIIDRVLRKHDIIPIRVDRIEHNDDIDKRILAELYSCDLALADLTYARPSVYFEAGFAQRKVPVIYTCRRDHFTPRVNDPEGNLRVHFDLQMRNIVAWQDQRDRAFKDRLSQRIAHVIAPLLHKKEIEEQAQEDARRFAALSTEEKTKRVLGLCVSQLSGAMFSQISKETWNWRYGSNAHWDRRNGLKKPRAFHKFLDSDHTWLGIKVRRIQIEFAFAFVVPALTKSVISDLKEFVISRPIYQTNPPGLRTVPAKLVEHIFVCSVNRVSELTLMNNLPNFYRDIESNVLIGSGTHLMAMGPIVKRGKVYAGEDPNYVTVILKDGGLEDFKCLGSEIRKEYDNEGKAAGRTKRIPRIVNIHILDRIQSESQFKTVMSDKVGKL